jgi:hypothetical protein
MADAMVALSNITLSGAQTTVTFSNLPASGYRDLRLVITGTSSASANITIQLNADTTAANYPTVYMQSDGSASTSAALNGYAGGLYGTTRAVNELDLFDYAQTDKHKSWIARFSAPSLASGSGSTAMIAGRWANTAAVTSLRLTLGGTITFSIGTVVTLYGIVG